MMGERWEQIWDEIHDESQLHEERGGIRHEIACKRIAVLEAERDDLRGYADAVREAVRPIVELMGLKLHPTIATKSPPQPEAQPSPQEDNKP